MLRRAITQVARATTPSRGYGVRFATINGTILLSTRRAIRNQVRAGMALEIDGKIYRVGKNQHVKPGKGGAYVQAELKEIKTGAKMNRRFRAAETVNKAPLGPDELFQFLYYDGDHLVIMHNTSFEQVRHGDRARPVLGPAAGVPAGGHDAVAADHRGRRAVGQYARARAARGDENHPERRGGYGAERQGRDAGKWRRREGTVVLCAVVPLFIEVGNKVKVSTEDGSYVDKL
ncbi:hypothetical protein ON010_g10437 [Phytophthora cinnamomi]|nr:hypothetical protein ON010_g10437 [Phytophthora cinnamomi]